jgi:hypothetical protein
LGVRGVDLAEQVAVAVEEGAVDAGCAGDRGDAEVVAAVGGVVEGLDDALPPARTARKPGSAYAAWEYAWISPLRIVRRRTRARVRSVSGVGALSAFGGS